MTLNENEKRLAPEFERATSLRDEGNFDGAVEALRTLLGRLEAEDTRLTAHAFMQLGYIYGELQRAADSEAAFRAAVQVSPKRELASLGLFHALRKMGRTTEAYEEMVRLLRLRDSQLYRELLCDGFEEGVHGDDLKHVETARRLLDEHRKAARRD